MIRTIKAKLVAKKDDLYQLCIFENLEEPQDSWDKYITVTKLPNWQTQLPKFGEEGFLIYEVAKAGEKYYKPELDLYEQYRKDGQYFQKFMSLNHEQTNESTIYKF